MGTFCFTFYPALPVYGAQPAPPCADMPKLCSSDIPINQSATTDGEGKGQFMLTSDKWM